MKRTVYFLSDHTGITVEAIGRSLLSQFEELEYNAIHWPFLDKEEKAQKAVAHINATAASEELRPIVFSTLVNPKIRDHFKGINGIMFDFFETFTGRLENELGMTSCPIRGISHGMANKKAYNERIHAVNFALANDDGATVRNFHSADLILIGVSRSGKTPTCIYLGLQYGVLAANYPLTEDELEKRELPASLHQYMDKLYGLTIDPQQLSRIRSERRANSRYASLEQCEEEVKKAEFFFRDYGIPFINTTSLSIEEIAAKLLQRIGLESRIRR